MPNEISYLRVLDWSISNRRDVWLVLLVPCFKEIPVFNANSLDPDQTPRSAASDLDLDCLPMSHLWDARHKWINLTLNGHCFNIICWALYCILSLKCGHKKVSLWKRCVLGRIRPTKVQISLCSSSLISSWFVYSFGDIILILAESNILGRSWSL